MEKHIVLRDVLRPVLTKLSEPEWLAFFLSALSGGFHPTLPKKFALKPQQRSELEDLVASYRSLEDERDTLASMEHVQKLMDMFPLGNMTQQTAANRAEGYLISLEHLPSWAVGKACERWLRAEAGEQNYSFAPTAPQLCGIAKEVLAGFRARRRRIEHLLEAK